MKQDVTILVCCHKKDFFLKNKDFMPIHVGKELNPNIDLGIQGDNSGDNISKYNPNFCELTAHYWYWKNCQHSKYVGLCHYRRYFDFKKKINCGLDWYSTTIENIVNDPPILPNLDDIFEKYDIVLAKSYNLPYSLSMDYHRAHIKNDLDILEEVIKDKYPQYLDSYRYIMHYNNKLCPYNMFIVCRDYFVDYSKWLFDILFEVQKRIKISEYLDQARVFGYMSERLLNVYVSHNKMRKLEVPVVKVDSINNISPMHRLLLTWRNNIFARFMY